MLNEILKKNPLIAIDLGTTKFCACRIYFDEKVKLDIQSVPAQGMHRGMLSNFEEADKALGALIEKAEAAWETDIQRVVTGIAGSHLFSDQIKASETVHGDVVHSKHLDHLFTRAEGFAKKRNYELLHMVTQDFKLDDREWIDTPLGFSANTVTGRYLGIYCDESYLKDVIRLMNKNGLQVEEVYAEPFASATVSVSPDLRDRGCVVADIGGGTTDGIVFQNGKPALLFTVNVAGNLMSRDLAMGLRTDIDSAERIKKRFGLNLHASPVPVTSTTGENVMVTPEDVSKILEARIRDLGGLLVDSLASYKGALPGGIVLTGGGAQVIGIENYLSELLRIEVRKCLPSLQESASEVVAKQEISTPYATVIGLLNLEISRICEKKLKENQFWPSRYLERFVDWIRELS